jgi:hypothetical protein
MLCGIEFDAQRAKMGELKQGKFKNLAIILEFYGFYKAKVAAGTMQIKPAVKRT